MLEIHQRERPKQANRIADLRKAHLAEAVG